jgi:hypothetical protein
VGWRFKHQEPGSQKGTFNILSVPQIELLDLSASLDSTIREREYARELKALASGSGLPWFSLIHSGGIRCVTGINSWF